MTTLEAPHTGVAAARLRLALTRLMRTLRRESHTTLTASQVSALATIEEYGPMRISALATLEAMDPSVATRVVAMLETQGLFVRESDPEDRRASLVSLSDVGRVQLAALWNERTLELDARLARLTPGERAALEAALPALEKMTRDE
jgi:DNA-binding MarR family transcriptional regulator